MCAPMVVALYAIPRLIAGLGDDRFGLLSIVWMLVGYFSIFDLGLGRALTKTVAERLGTGRSHEVPAVFWTAFAVMVALGALGGLLVYGVAPWIAERTVRSVPELLPETLRSFRAVAFGLPMLITITGLIGTLEACHRFPLINAVRIPTGAFTFLGPLLVLPFSTSLYAVVLVLLAGRLVEWLIFFVCCLRVVPGLRMGWAFRRDSVPELLGFGGWMTVSNILLPLMIHMDRFLIAAIRAVGEVAYYVTSAEIVVKLLILPRAWVSVLFPTFAAQFHQRRADTSELFAQSIRLLLAALFPVVLGIVLFAPEGLTLWLGPAYGDRSAPVMRWLTAGIFLYSLAFVPTSLLQAIGRPDLTAKVHAIEMPLYLALASLLIHRFGIQGAAVAWLLRATFDAACLFTLAVRQAPECRAGLARVLPGVALALVLLALAAWPQGLLLKAGYGLVAGGLFAAASWRWLLSDGDRRAVWKRLDRWRHHR